ncbi:hypothetical protein ASPZODRAFT_620844 [Penicilliopsis zonata CBS 506.65]|uniref:DUF967 domain protein n=1 Tax=Penicilliopsis zonata CBS 506.65 TaxID=1073090 RepID=A0A1L9SEA1_9EURO|nr:hypothetical protein ASPZODRAFT_620844 [Penicilliopsis zonata CBS 506.65]OJJ45511.1 hypothetical protein ASPZODRAFT_620844 [Penicilliopsis zonata CBS 506.65]
MAARPLGTPSTDATVLAAIETSPSLTFPTFTAATALDLGLALRSRILALPSSSRKPAVISIALTGCEGIPQIVFQCVTESGTVPDNEVWVRRKRNTVLRFGVSSWLMRQKMVSATNGLLSATSLEDSFTAKFAVDRRDYAIHGGGVPIRVRGVDGVLGAIVVSGLKQEDDHQVVVETIEEWIRHAN